MAVPTFLTAEWRKLAIANYAVERDLLVEYGDRFSFLAEQKPKSVMLAEGSRIAVKAGAKILYQQPQTDIKS
jgi:hypothetical protein